MQFGSERSRGIDIRTGPQYIDSCTGKEYVERERGIRCVQLIWGEVVVIMINTLELGSFTMRVTKLKPEQPAFIPRYPCIILNQDRNPSNFTFLNLYYLNTLDSRNAPEMCT
jgi:hypothetical protein